MSVRLLHGDCRDVLPTLADESVHCVVTSPPYWGLRDYGTGTWDGGDADCDHRNGNLVSDKSGLRNDGRAHVGPYDGEKAVSTGMPYRATCGKCGATRIDRQLGLEPTPELYLAHMVAVFREVRRVLRVDGTCWVNMGDSYSGGGGFSPDAPSNRDGNDRNGGRSRLFSSASRRPAFSLKPKDLVGMPWKLAFALQADGWFLRSDIIWAKPNPMPESVTDRPTKAHEYVFLLTKSARYFYDADAVREASTERPSGNVTSRPNPASNLGNGDTRHAIPYEPNGTGRNLRSVWTIVTEPTPDAHFATFPRKLVAPCILAGTSAKGACAACGAPWVREVERSLEATRGNVGSHNGAGRSDADDAGSSYQWNGGVYGRYRVETTGWQPTCDHGAAVVPCTVLDPFAGTGTVGRVAEDLGRHSVLIELNQAYVTLAEHKTAQIGLFASRMAGAPCP